MSISWHHHSYLHEGYCEKTIFTVSTKTKAVRKRLQHKAVVEILME